MGPNRPAGPGWQQVPPPVPCDQCQSVIMLRLYQANCITTPPLQIRATALNSWPSAIILLSQDKKFKHGKHDNSKDPVYVCHVLFLGFPANLKTWRMSVACDRSDVIPYVSWCHWLGPWPVPGSPSHNMVTTHPGYWPHNLSVLFCGEATTSTTSAGSYLIVSNYSYWVIRVILVLKSFGFPVMHSWWWILAVWKCWLNVIDWDIKMIL